MNFCFKKSIHQFSRYCVVGGISFAVDYFVLWLLTEEFALYYLVSSAISFTAGLLVNYVLSTIWVFDERNIKNKNIEFLFFSIIGVIGLLLNQLIMWILTAKYGVYYMYSKLISTAIVLVWNFFGRKYLVFSVKI
ncbi:MAG: GtrA family protein [Elusimicrobiales bacterium]|nr:GtrA family protein [Elusimicrobiales bacterium]